MIRDLAKSPWCALFFLIFIPIINQVWFNAWIFTPNGWIDSWKYVGYGYNFSDPKYEDCYKISRIPWIYLQYLVRKIGPTLVATYVLQYFCLWLGTFSTYFCVRKLFGNAAALIAALFLSIYPPYLGSGGADYHNTLAGPLYALSFLILTTAALNEQHVKKWLILFGIVFSMTIHTTMFYVNFVLILAIHFFLVRRTFNKKSVSVRGFASSSLLGFVFGTLALGLISRIYGHDFLFFRRQMTLVTKCLVDNVWLSGWWKPLTGDWLVTAFWLGPLAAGILFSIGLIVFARRLPIKNPVTSLVLAVNGQFVLLGLFWTVWQVCGKPMLNVDYATYPLIIPFAISIAANFRLFFSDDSSHFLAAFFGILCILILYFIPSHSSILLNLLSISFVFTFGCFLLFFVSILLLKKRPIYSIIFLAIATTVPFLHRHVHEQSGRECYLAIIEANQWIKNIKQRSARHIYGWFDDYGAGKPFSEIGYSLFFGIFRFIDSPWPMPAIRDLKLEQFAKKWNPKNLVVLITDNKEDVIAMQARFQEIGVSLNEIQSREIKVGQTRIPIYALSSN